MTRDFWPIGVFFFNGGSHALGRVGGGGEVRVRVRATQVCAGMVWFLSTPS